MNSAQRFFALATIVAASHACHAQPDPNNTVKATNPPNRDRNAAQAARQAQALAVRQARYGEQVGRRLTAYGVTDKKVQDAVVAYMIDLDNARAPLRDATLKLRPAMRNQAIKDKELGVIINDYQVAQEDYQERRHQAETKLDQQIGYTKKPRLQAALILAGVFGAGDLAPRLASRKNE